MEEGLAVSAGTFVFFWSGFQLRNFDFVVRLCFSFAFILLQHSFSSAQTMEHLTGGDSSVTRIVTFGTSLTARGEWQSLLSSKLSHCLAKPVPVEIAAQSGATSDWGVEHIEDVVKLRPDIVIIEFYGNDAALFRLISVAHSRENITRILKAFREELPGVRLIIQIMNPFSGMRGMARPFIDSYIEAHKQEAAAIGAEIVDHRPRWLTMSASQLAEAIPDGAHPTAAAAAAVIVPALARQIGGPSCS
jgi:acyl-CoA thioesterase I